MSDFNPLVQPIPLLFVIDPQPEKSPTAIWMIDVIGEYQTLPIRNGDNPSDPDYHTYTLFNRFLLPALFYIFGNYDHFSMADLQQYAPFMYRFGFIFAVVLESIIGNDSDDYIANCHLAIALRTYRHWWMHWMSSLSDNDITTHMDIKISHKSLTLTH